MAVEIIEGQYKKYRHARFTFEWYDTFVVCEPDGTMTITQKSREDGEPVEDVILVKPAFIYRLASMLSASKQIISSDKPYKKGDGDLS